MDVWGMAVPMSCSAVASCTDTNIISLGIMVTGVGMIKASTIITNQNFLNLNSYLESA